MVIELTDGQAAKLHAAFVARFATGLALQSAPKGEQKALAQVADWQDGQIEQVLATAQTSNH